VVFYARRRASSKRKKNDARRARLRFMGPIFLIYKGFRKHSARDGTKKKNTYTQKKIDIAIERKQPPQGEAGCQAFELGHLRAATRALMYARRACIGLPRVEIAILPWYVF
jgi:hypothetical protein